MLWHEPDRAHEVFHHSLPTSAGVPLTVAPAIADFPGFLTKERPTMNLTRLLILPLAILLTLGLAGVASGVATSTVTSKTINVTNGECVNPGNPPTLADGVTPCGAAVYGPTGFTGHIHGTGTGSVSDYICVHTSGNGPFLSFGTTYTFTVYDSNGGVIATTTETVNPGQDCTGTTNWVTSGSLTGIDFDANGGVVAYSVLITNPNVTSANAQATFDSYNSIRNEAFGDSGQARSASVAPPGPPGEIPEAPAAILLVLTAGFLGLAFVARRRLVAGRATV